MPTIAFQVTVLDSVTHAAIVGAQTFMNGVVSGTTDSGGHASLSVDSVATFDLTVKFPGYNTIVTNGIVPSQGSVVLSLETVTTQSTRSFNLTIYPEADAAGVPLSFSNGGSPITANYSIGGIDVDGLTIGPQTITGTVEGFTPISSTFDISEVTSGLIQLSAPDDSGAKKGTTQPVVQDPSIDTLLPALTPEDSPEFTAPNTGQGTYFTMTQARMYIGALFIDELNALQFTLQDNKIPIYGYASRFYDAMAQGKSLVQGQFTINFISEGYLYTVLNEYQNQLIQADIPVDPVAAQQQARLQSLVNRLQNPDPTWTPTQITAAKTEINALAASLGPTALANANAGISAAKRQQNNSILGLAGGDYPNAVYSDISFDVVLEYTGAGRTITRRLEDCHLISNESIMDHSGTPILDSYGFIAHRVR